MSNKYTAAKEKSIIIRLSQELHLKIKEFCLKNDMSMTNMFIQCIKEKMNK